MVETSPRSNLGDPALGHAHPLGDLGLSQAERLAPLGQAVAVDVGLVAVAGLGNGLLAARPGDDVVPNVVPLGKARHRPSSVSASYSSYNRSARGIALRYQPLPVARLVAAGVQDRRPPRVEGEQDPHLGPSG
jgi:hypothetical protein